VAQGMRNWRSVAELDQRLQLLLLLLQLLLLLRR